TGSSAWPGCLEVMNHRYSRDSYGSVTKHSGIELKRCSKRKRRLSQRLKRKVHGSSDMSHSRAQSRIRRAEVELGMALRRRRSPISAWGNAPVNGGEGTHNAESVGRKWAFTDSANAFNVSKVVTSFALGRCPRLKLATAFGV